MLSKGTVRDKVFETCRWVGIPIEDIEFKVTGDFEAYRHGQWRAEDYLFFARWDKGSPTVHAIADGSLLRHTEVFCDACASAALFRFLDEANRHDEYPDEWVPYQKARAILASEGFVKFNMVFPKGSFVRVCDCGEAEVWSPAEVAFGRTDGLCLPCPSCGEDAHVGLMSNCVMTSESGLYVEDESGLTRLTTKILFKYRSLDLDNLLDEGLVDDIRNVGMATFLEEGGMGFAESWVFLSKHPMFEGHFPECFDFDVAMVCRDTARIEDDSSRDTCPQVWVEGGWCSASEFADCDAEELDVWEKLEGTMGQDMNLETGGWTFEEAVCNLAMAVKYHYGDGGKVPVAISGESAA